MPRVVFGRVNRRHPESVDMQPRPFEEDVKALVEARTTKALALGHLWVAADLTLDAHEDFLIGVLGYSTHETFQILDEETFSWLKGEELEAAGATVDTMTPFAIDLRENRRWIGFTSTRRIRQRNFTNALSIVMTTAAAEAGLVPLEWDVDLSTPTQSVIEWLADHPSVQLMTRVVRTPNPRKVFDEDRKRLQQLDASWSETTYHAHRGKDLDLQGNQAFDDLVEGIEEGYIEIRLTSREGSQKAEFFSRKHAAIHQIAPFGSDLSLGMASVLEAVKDYSRIQAGEPDPQGTIEI